MEKDKSRERSSTALATASLSVNMYARLPRNTRNNTKNTDPMIEDVTTTLTIENHALLALPAPSSFATRTLNFFFFKGQHKETSKEVSVLKKSAYITNHKEYLAKL